MLNLPNDFDKKTSEGIMGGYGSGRRYSWGGKRTTESQHRIDIRWLKKQGCLRPGNRGSLSWSCGDEQTGSIGYKVEKDHMILDYRHSPRDGEWDQVEESVSFDRTPCNYGGYRRWFLCPGCWRRVAVLYGAGKFFLCRHCHDLTYRTQKESPIWRLTIKERRIRQRLGGGGNLLEPFPFKPKGMHWKTYSRLYFEAEEARVQYCELFSRRFGRIA